MSSESPTEDRYRRVFAELHHNHLPALEAENMIVHDRDADVVWDDTDEPTRELLAVIEQFKADR